MTDDFDLVDDLIHYINNDPEFYRTRFYPVVHKFEKKIKNGEEMAHTYFSNIVKQAYSRYIDKFELIDFPEDIDADTLDDVCKKIKKQHLESIHKDIKNEDLSYLRRLAGIPDYIPQLNKTKIMKENGLKPGTKEWFDNWFPLDTSRFPSGFRGRKK